MYSKYLRAFPARTLIVVSLSISVLNGCTSFKRYRRSPNADTVVANLVRADATGLEEAKAQVLSMGAGAMPDLRDALENAPEATTESSKVRIVETAATIGKPATLLVEILEIASHDSSPAVRQAAAFRAGSFPSIANDLAPMLTPLLRDKVHAVRAAALSSLGAFPASVDIDTKELSRLTLDPEPQVAASAAAIAARRPEPAMRAAAIAALPRLVEGLKNKDSSARAAAAYALGQYGRGAQSAVPAMITALGRERVPEVKLQTAMALVRIGTIASRRAGGAVLREFAKSKTPSLKSAAESALKAFNEPT